MAPPTNAPNPSPQYSGSPYPFDFTRLGVRIPAVLVSPWLDARVDDTLYDLTSIPAFIKRLFGLCCGGHCGGLLLVRLCSLPGFACKRNTS